MIQNGSIIK